MKNSFIYIILMSYAFLMHGCGDINENHDLYLQDGETIYTAKVDSVEAYSGNKRILLRSYAQNIMIQTIAVFWDQKSDSLIYQIENKDDDYFDIWIGDDTPLEEREYVFEIYSRDGMGNRSIKFETVAKAFGDKYQSNLKNHSYESTNYNDENNELLINWYSSTDKTEKGIELTYKNPTTGEVITEIKAVEDLEGQTSLIIEPEYPVSYQTFFLPSETSIDTFYAESSVKVEVIGVSNCSLNKSVIASDILKADFGPENAVDGVISGPSRWISNKSNLEHWLEIDLGEEFEINKVELYSCGSDGVLGWETENFSFQIEKDGVWEDVFVVTGNTSGGFERTFDPVFATKVRYYVPAYDNNMVRLAEIKVSAIKRY